MNGDQRVVADIDDKDLDHLVRLRLVVARVGEMDNARWWNTKGLLGRLGAMALERGFPKSHYFAQARGVFSVAANRCREVFDPPDAITLWKLPAELEDRFESMWPIWTEEPADWNPLFEKLSEVGGSDLLTTMRDLDVIDDKEIGEAKKLRRAADNRAVPLPGAHELSRSTLTMLAAGFFRGEPGQPAIPYARVEYA